MALTYAMKVVGTHNEELHELLLPIYENASCFTAVEPMLKELNKRQVTTAILSNGTPTMLEAGAKNAQIHHLLDHILSVDAVGVFKPDPSVYQYALDQLGVDKSELLFCSSNQWDVAGASAFGLNTVWINQYQEVAEPFEPGATFVINHLSAIDQLIY